MRTNPDVSDVDARPQPLPSAPADVARAERLSDAPLSFAQERLWFLHQLDPGSHYNDHFHLRLAGPLDVEALEQSLREIGVRHETLRTTFAVRDGRPVQRVHPPGPWHLPVADLEGVPEPRRLAEALRLAVEKGSAPFDLTTGPLWRFELLRLNPDDHLFLVTAHHIAIDGWSRGVFLRELSTLYDAVLSGRPSPLARLPLQMGDFAASERGAPRGPTDPSIEYWKNELRDLPSALELPTDRPRPSSPSHRGARQPLAFDRRLTSHLKEFGRSERATLFMTLLAGFAAVLYRYTGKTDLVVGSPVANRSRTEVEGLIGFFVNMLPLRVRVGADDTFRDLVRRIRRSALDAYEHQDFSFEELVRLVQPVRTRSHHPLFQVLFVFQNRPMCVSSAHGLAIRPVEVDPGTAKFDLTVNLAEADGRLEGWIEYATDLFDADRIERMAGHLERLLDGSIIEPDTWISRLPLLRGEELRELLVERNATSAAYPRDRCIQELFEAVVDEAPDAVAVVGEGERLTYRELDRHANRLARYLKRRGVGPEVPVGVCLERSVDAVVSFLAILKAGGAYVPLDPAQPKARLAVLLQDASPPLVLTTSLLAAGLPEHAAARVELDSEKRVIRAESPERLAVETSAESLAYLMYTSGSTGAPKGVAVVHRGIVRLVRSADYARLSSDGVFLQLAPLAFDASTFEIWGALLNGARLVVAPREAPSLAELERVLRDHGVTTLWLTAGLFDAMVDEKPEALKGVRQVLTGGDVLSVPRVAKFRSVCPESRLINGYGPTEGTTFTCCYEVTEDVSEWNSIPIGRPIANTRVYLLDSNRQPVPVGIPGELYIGGDGLGRGYVGRPDLTVEKFVADPFGLEPGGRLYRTGDRARYRSDGVIEFLGRLDGQVKIRGYCVEPGEVESTLRQHPSVRDAVVVMRESAVSGKALSAYVVVARDASVSTEKLVDFLLERLPEYMLPSTFTFLRALPLTENGKVDRQALPVPAPPEARGGFVAPRNDLERELAAIWEETLGVKPIGIRDNFFDLGGHSLLAAKLVARIERAVGRSIPLVVLFDAPTIERLADLLQGEGWVPSWSSLVPIRREGSKVPLFCVHGVGGNVVGFRDLAKHLSADQPVYGVQAVGLDGQQAPLTRVEDMARHYVKEIRTVQSEGPYHVAGASFGGNVAFEMARQLRAAGSEVGLIALLDTFATTCLHSKERGTTVGQSLRAYGERMWFHLGNLFLQPGRLSYVRKKSKTLKRRIRSQLWRIAFHSYEVRSRRLPGALQDVKESCYLAGRRYVPTPYTGRVTLFRAKKRSVADSPDVDLGWGSLAGGGVEIYEVPGDHESMLGKPHVAILAGKIQTCLDRREADRLREPTDAALRRASSAEVFVTSRVGP